MNDPKKDENHVHHENMNHEQSPNDVENNLDQQQNVFSDVGRDEETASEITGFDNDILDRDDDIDVDNQVGNIPGWIGLALAVLSFFMMPIIFGAAAIIVGFFARSRDANWLGNTAIALGAISIIIRLFFIPF
ncbi:MAG TPA: hypothetical protein VK135_04260 [Candidatus Dormibacteraeota bacterium]|nr:hypothetical protein [Candidatus Dormibacteraeota bacterium]